MRITILLLITVILTACGTQQATYVDARAAAMTAIAVATERGHAWTTSDQLIDEADKAAQDGNESLAILLADEARIHAELAVEQADREATAWRDNLISN